MQIEKQLKELELFLENVENFLVDQAKRAQSSDERRKMEDYFPNLLRSSLFVTIYSAAENELNRLCRENAKEDGLDVEDLRGNGIQRACTFLIKVCRVDFPEHSAEWGRMQDYNQLRNIIVHNSGVDSGHQLGQLAETSAGLAVGRKSVIHMQREFCPDVLATVRDFFAKLQTALDKKTRPKDR